MIPGFSSDLIRLDQARSRKHPQNQSRLNKLRAVTDAKAAFRREREEAKAKAAADMAAAAASQAPGGDTRPLDVVEPAALDIPAPPPILA